VLGAIWTAELRFRRPDAPDPVAGALSLAGILVGFFVGAFELALWLQPEATDMTRLFWSESYVFATAALWGTYAAITVLVGIQLRASAVRILGVLLSAVALVFLLTSGLTNLGDAPLVRLLAFIACVPGTYLAVYMARRAPGGILPAEPQVMKVVAMGAAVLSAVWGSVEILHGFPRPAAACSVVIWLTLYGLGALAFGLRGRSPEARIMGVVIVALAALLGPAAAYMDGQTPGLVQLATFAASIGGVYLAAWLVRLRPGVARTEEQAATEWLSLGSVVMTLVWIYLQVNELQLSGATVRDFLLSAAVAAYGFVVLTAGFFLAHRKTRLLAIGIVGLTILKVAVRDMWHLELVWRVWIGAGIGTMLVVASLAYQRFVRIIVGEDGKE
ncbi:MAG TPA: DUF2339 domain-containing protein, partial [Symbiobacteriaceae bacterium]|nr:DUF2339 domain-containing protein [Symbiobacteriaceae bacterium]